MSADMPERLDMTDDLDAAYTQAHALSDDGRGPSASVRANVLAAARAVAAEAAARVAAAQAVPPTLTPVAPPVATVGRGRAPAVNLSSWRVRSGAALCAILLVGLVSWRFDAAHRIGGGVQVALAELKLAQAPTAALPKELPVPAVSAASYPYAAPPPVVEDPVDHASDLASAKPALREKIDKELIVAQAEQAGRLARSPAPEAIAPARRALADSAPVVVAEATPAAPVVVAANAPAAHAAAPAQAPQAVTVTGSVATQFATKSAMPPSVLPRRVPVISAAPPPALAKPAPSGETIAAADAAASPSPRGDAARADIGLSGGSALAGVGESAKKAAPVARDALVNASAPAPAPTLQSAADRGDVEGLRQLLANPAVRVDAPDAAGRSALLHAVLAQHADAVRLLVAAGADPDRADPAGLTPRAAAQTGTNAEIAALLPARR